MSTNILSLLNRAVRNAGTLLCIFEIRSDRHTTRNNSKLAEKATEHSIHYNRSSLDSEIGDASRTVTDV